MPFGLGKSSRQRELTSLIDEDMVGLLEPGVEIEGKLIISCGILRLNTRFKGHIESAATLIVHGDIYTPCLVIDPGGYFEGQCHMPVPEAKPQAQTAPKPEVSLLSSP